MMLSKADVESIKLFAVDYQMEIPKEVNKVFDKVLDSEGGIKLRKTEKTKVNRYLGWFIKRNEYILSDYEKTLLGFMVIE
jgi:hypothetical protein